MSEDRTWLATVLFLDIVSYSMIAVNEQLAIKRHFQNLIGQEISGLEEENTIRLDTGDGMAICYLGDPERMYPIARRLRDAFVSLQQGGELSYSVRLGLNLGPIKVVEDLNGKRNCIGAGINDAERVMSFAAANQLLVSKSYFEIVSRMSQNYANELSHLGLREDKHKQQHDVYELAVEVVRVNDFPHTAAAPSSQVASSPVSERFDPAVIEKISNEYAKYVGREQSQTVIQQSLGKAANVHALSALLLDAMDNSDERYDFDQFLKYYGYSGYS